MTADYYRSAKRGCTNGELESTVCILYGLGPALSCFRLCTVPNGLCKCMIFCIEKKIYLFSRFFFFSLKYSKDTRFFGLGNSFKRKRGRPPLPSSLCSCPIHLASLLIATTLSVISCMISPSLLNLTDFILIRHHHTCRLKKGSRFDPQFPAILQKSIQVLPLSLFLLGNFGFG